MSVAVRFAPSPSGYLQIGNIRAALVNWLFARHHGGTFLLRIDDTDAERTKPEYIDGIYNDLKWLGLNWDREAQQSKRMAQYAAAAEKLKADGRLYPCYETEEELGLKRKSLLGRGLPPVYDRAALSLSAEEKAALEAKGRKPHWRFKLNIEDVVWEDGIRGHCHINASHVSDPILIREDGVPVYILASVVDDIELGITDIIRGEDHVTNTAVQIQIMEALGGKAVVPRFAHFSMFTNKEGAKLSKRSGSLSVRDLREEFGIEPMALLSLLAKLGTSDPIEARLTQAELAGEFNLGSFSRNPSKFDPDEMLRLNARIMHLTPFSGVQSRLATMGLTGIDENFWNVIRPNLEKLADAAQWWHVARETVQGGVEDSTFSAAAANLLPPEPWTAETWETWVSAVKTDTGRKGKELFMPLRKAITGMEHGPELKVLLPLIGRQRVLDRLSGKAA